jgi:glycosyltransferase involved in cell wall biosynthesis
VSGNGKPTALLLAPEPPYPLIGGGALRAGSILHYLAQHYTVDAIFFRECGAPWPGDHLPAGLIRRFEVIDLPFHSRRTAVKLFRNLKRLIRRTPPLIDRFSGFDAQVTAAAQGNIYDLGVIEHFWCAPYVHQLAPFCRRLVLDLHNIESVWHERCAIAIRESLSMTTAHRLFRDACVALEKTYFPHFSLLLATSEYDAEHVRRILPGARVSVYPNTIPLTPQPVCCEREEIVLSGTFDYEPNRIAVRFFREQIWPVLRRRWPRLIWRLVGRNPESIRAHVGGDDRIVCSGPVAEAVPELAAAKVAVVPLLSGSGTRLKIIEAWAAGRPVVSTRLGAEGLPAIHAQNIFLADSASEFADAVSALLESASLRQSLGTAGRLVYENCLTWNRAWDLLSGVLDQPKGSEFTTPDSRTAV